MDDKLNKLIELNKQNNEFNKELNKVFDNVVQKKLSEWFKILSPKEYHLALKKNFFYNHIIRVGTNGYHDDETGKKSFNDRFLNSIEKEYNKDMRFIYHERYGFVEIQDDMPYSPFGRSTEDNISLKIEDNKILYSRNYSQFDGFGSKIKSFNQSLEFCLKKNIVDNVTMDRKDIFNLFAWDSFVNFGMEDYD